MSEKEYPLPPATFDFLVGMARHSIDLVAMIQEKTRGNLSIEEQRLIENEVLRLTLREKTR